jgi:hypothetical protein
MVDIFMIRPNAWDFFVLARTFSLLAAVLCGRFFLRQTCAQTVRVSLHVIDRQGNDRGSLGETWVPASDRSS